MADRYIGVALLGLGVLVGSSSLRAEDVDSTVVSGKASTRETVTESPTKVKTVTKKRVYALPEEQPGTGLAVFLGLDVGMLQVTPASTINETSRSSLYLGGHAAFSYYSRSAVLDLGLGWMTNSLSYTERLRDASGNLLAPTPVTVKTRTGFLEFSPRYRISDIWEIGPVGTFYFGTDSSFSAPPSTQRAVFAGLKLMAGFPVEDFRFRAGLQAITDLTLPDRSAYMAGLMIEIGLPILRGRVIRQERETLTSEQREKIVFKEVVNFVFDDQLINFEYNKSDLTPETRKFLSQLGQFLGANPDIWEGLKVEGHTDSRGKDEYNLMLSQARSDAAKRGLAEGGAPAEKIEAKGYGESKPLDPAENELAWARNRRVEMNFVGVTDAQKLRDGMNRIRWSNMKPSTCVGDKCR